MAKSEMGEKELLEWLYAYKYWSRHLTSPGQYIAYDRLVKIVKEHFKPQAVTREWLIEKLQEVEKRPDLLWHRSLLLVTEVLKDLGYQILGKGEIEVADK